MTIAYTDLTRPALASRKEVSEYLGIPVQTMAAWAAHGEGPRYRRVGKHARYEWVDVRAWLDSQVTGGTTA